MQTSITFSPLCQKVIEMGLARAIRQASEEMRTLRSAGGWASGSRGLQLCIVAAFARRWQTAITTARQGQGSEIQIDVHSDRSETWTMKPSAHKDFPALVMLGRAATIEVPRLAPGFKDMQHEIESLIFRLEQDTASEDMPEAYSNEAAPDGSNVIPFARRIPS
ncbi:hypothetical protein [Mycoplana dimorpha]|uniref:Uncharacterized protein n=1 Tax=Mycoplana dimorpha TaxID=28320 RepID=A0A2T5AHG9_MYCDI|nr:hypothetical protein [Mycoplana dimorpha]PTM86167.1 hypothetical protein C7449_1194 [Mycoplana dimorpha]